MNYKLLGNSGLRVSEICLGTMTFGTEWAIGATKPESKKIFDLYAKAGGNFLDTANRYTLGTSEKYVGEFIKSERDYFVLATKYTLSMNHKDPNAGGTHRKNMMQSIEQSLKRLKTDYIDLYWVHMWDEMTPVEEVMRGLEDLVRSGKVLYIGVSDTPAWRVSQANTLAELRGWAKFVGLQIEYSLIERTVERDLIPMTRALNLGVTAWAPLGGGLLTGKYVKSGSTVKIIQKTNRTGNIERRGSSRNMAVVAEVMKIAEKRSATPAQVAINWLRNQPGVVIPIVGARTPKQIKDSLGCLKFNLTEQEMKRLDKLSAVEMGFPQKFLSQDDILQIIYGNHAHVIKNHRN